MPFDIACGRLARRFLPVVSILGASAAAFIGLTHPAMAASVLAAVQSAVTCAATGTSACVSGTDTSSGIGVLGTSNSGTGVRGTANTNYGMKGSSGTSYGIFGTSTSGIAGVAGTTANGYGVYGYTTGSGNGAVGVFGTSSNGYGVSGQSTNGTAGVIGTTAENVGVIGKATGNGTGIEGTTAGGTGLYGTTTSGKGIGVFGYETATGPGVLGESSTGAAVQGIANGGGFGGFFSSSYEAVVGQSSAFPLLLQNGSGTTIFYVDSVGDVYYHGGLHTFAATAGGATVKAFTAKMATPSVEDTGTAQLVGGSATVRLDPTFAATIDLTTPYRVFVTPNGDTHGLFVATKTAGGFIVREAQAGRSTVTFDYRIVATSLGQAGQRMTATSTSAAPAGPRGTLNIAPPRPPGTHP